MAKLAVLDPNGLFRAGLVSLLQAQGFTDLVDAGDLAELGRRVGDGPPPDVVLVNLSRGGEAINETMRDAAELFDHVRVVFLADTLDLDQLARCFAAGASGYLLENISRDTLGNSLTLVSAGGKVFPPELALFISNFAAKPVDQRNGEILAIRDSHLSGRELEILGCLTGGQSNKAIGQTLEIAEATVKVHVKRILRKIHARNRTQAALWAASRGLGSAANLNEPERDPKLMAVGAGMAPRHVVAR
jgi:two-component system, NarL family, nitrate/nitrite response regulator NarL